MAIIEAVRGAVRKLRGALGLGKPQDRMVTDTANPSNDEGEPILSNRGKQSKENHPAFWDPANESCRGHSAAKEPTPRAGPAKHSPPGPTPPARTRSNILSAIWGAAKTRPPHVTAAMVEACYRVLLNREPENRKVIDERVGATNDFETLLRSFVDCAEFRQSLSDAAPVARMYRAATKQVDVDVPGPVLDRLFARTQKQWERLGREQSFWSVITSDGFKTESLDEEARKRFYESGRSNADLIELFEKRAGVGTNRGVCAELGAGVGRVTCWLARKFDRVLALDISPGNLKECENMAGTLGLTNVECRLVTGLDAFKKLPDYDFFFSTIVLQHNPPPVQRFILDEMLGRINAGGGFLFQTQTHDESYHFDAEEYLRSSVEIMDMHVLPMRYVFDLLSRHGLKLKEVLMDTWTGLTGSHTFFGTK